VSGIVIPMWLPLVLVMMFEAARSPDRIQGLRTFLGYLTSIAVFIIPFYLKQCQKDMGFCIRLLLLSSVAPAFYAFVDFAHGGMGGENGNRVASLFPHPNIFAFYLVVVISLTFFMLKSKAIRPPPGQSWLLVAYIAVLLVDLLLTKTRSAWAACGVVFIVYGLMFERRYLVYIALAAVAALFVPVVQDRLMDLNAAPVYWSYASTQNSYEWRQLIWKSGLSWMSLSALPLGYGLQSFAYYSTEFFQLAGGTHWGAHNVYVQWLFEAGIVGLLCAAWLFYRVLSILKMGMRDDRLGTVIVITIVLEYLVVSYSDNMLEYLAFNWYFWFVVGTACSIVVARQAQASSALITDAVNGAKVLQPLP
jgi:putative inorganic carbon (HCO3(-)) transporter